MNSKIDVAIIVCCYNSASLLRPTLSHLAAQMIPEGLGAEIIIVDNNSSDNTAGIAQEVWNELNASIKFNVIKEASPGLSNARKAGIKSTEAEIIIFCDDDNWLSNNYLKLSYDFMQANPNVGMLGGHVQGELEAVEPLWWKEKANGYAVGKQAETSQDITKRGYVWGAGMVTRRSIFDRLYDAGFISLLVGRDGDALTSGDDNEFCRWAILMGYQIWYLDDLRMRHFITEKRLTDEYVERLFNGHKQSMKPLSYYMLVIRELKNNKQRSLFYLLSKGTLQAIYGIFLRREMTIAAAQVKLGTMICLHSIVHKVLVIRKKLNITSCAVSQYV